MKKLFCANLVPVIETDGVDYKCVAYKLDSDQEMDVGDNWNGDIESYIRKRHLEITTDKYFLDECMNSYKEYSLAVSLDRKGIKIDDELFCEFDDGDLWSMALYYTREE